MNLRAGLALGAAGGVTGCGDTFSVQTGASGHRLLLGWFAHLGSTNADRSGLAFPVSLKEKSI